MAHHMVRQDEAAEALPCTYCGSTDTPAWGNPVTSLPHGPQALHTTKHWLLMIILINNLSLC